MIISPDGEFPGFMVGSQIDAEFNIDLPIATIPVP